VKKLREKESYCPKEKNIQDFRLELLAELYERGRKVYPKEQEFGKFSSVVPINLRIISLLWP
jgi:hypothetical protein